MLICIHHRGLYCPIQRCWWCQKALGMIRSSVVSVLVVSIQETWVIDQPQTYQSIRRYFYDFEGPHRCSKLNLRKGKGQWKHNMSQWEFRYLIYKKWPKYTAIPPNWEYPLNPYFMLKGFSFLQIEYPIMPKFCYPISSMLAHIYVWRPQKIIISICMWKKRWAK